MTHLACRRKTGVRLGTWIHIRLGLPGTPSLLPGLLLNPPAGTTCAGRSPGFPGRDDRAHR